MLDPNWTPEAAYSHADALLAIIKRQEAETLNIGQPTENPQETDS